MNPNSPDAESSSMTREETPDSIQGLRNELRLGARMIEALENQLQRATRLIRAEEDASRHLSRRMAAAESMDTRLEEIEATINTVERRLDLQIETIRSSGTTSGSLSLEDSETSGAPIEDRAHEIRGDLQSELRAIRSATTALSEIVERAEHADMMLRATLEEVGSESGAPHRVVPSILRDLADEIETRVKGSRRPSRSEEGSVIGEVTVEVQATNDSVSPTPDRKESGAKAG